MSKARGLITGENLESRSSGMYDSKDNVRIAAMSKAGLKRVGMRYLTIHTTGMTYPYAFTWSPDGLHLYITYSGDYIKHYICTTPFNTSGASEQDGVAYFYNAYYESNVNALEVSPNGRYLYCGGTGKDSILQFTMGTAWNVTQYPNNTTFSAGYEQLNKRLNNIFALGTADSYQRGCEFNGDGTKFYLVGYGDDNIMQFSLSSAYEVGSQSYDGYYNLGGDGNTSPYNMRWNNDGTKFFVCDQVDKIIEYSVSNAYDVTSGTITEGTVLSTTSYESSPLDVGFNADGTKMYVIGNGGDEINEWTLSTGFDLSSTVTHVSATSLGMGNPAAFDFNPTGTKMVVIDYDSDLMKAFNLSTPFNSSTIGSAYESFDLSSSQWVSTPTGSTYITNSIVTPTGCRFNGDGTTVTIMDRYSSSYDKAVSYPLLTAYELSTIADGCINLTAVSSDYPVEVRFNPDGTKVYVMDGNDDAIRQWSLAVPYVLGKGSSVMTYDGASPYLGATDASMKGFDFAPDGKSIYTCGNNTDTIAHFTLSAPYDVTGTVTATGSIDTTSFESNPHCLRVVNTPNGYKLHMLGTDKDKIFEMDLNF